MATILEQAIDWQRNEITRLEALQVQYDNAANTLSPQYRAAKQALKDAQNNPATPPATLAQLQADFDRISSDYFAARDNASANFNQLKDIKDALDSNLLKLNDPTQNPSFANTASNTTAYPGQDPQVNQQANVAASNTTVVQPAQGTEAPGTGQAAETPADESPTEQVVIDALDDETAAMAEPITAEEPTSQDVIDAEEDPFLQSEMIAAQAEQEPPTSQDIIDAEEDPYARAQMELAQSDPGDPTEQVVIDAIDDDLARIADENDKDAPEYIPPTDDDVRSATNAQGLQNVNSPNAQASAQDEVNFNLQKDWRVRLSLAEGAYYLYENKDSPGILAPLADTKGVIFPYTPQIQVQYVANYDPTTVTHSNYKIYQYNSSSIDNITITGDFTAQDTFEANYLLAVIHFFRSVTKMFYAQDKDPKAGTPPPLCYLHGLGAFQFDTHPLVITSFNYNLPNNVDYIRASINEQTKIGPDSGGTTGTASQTRLKGISPGGRPMPVQFATGPKNQKEPTYVPTKIQLQISAAPMISRNQISNDFSVKQYASGELLRGSKRQKPGVW